MATLEEIKQTVRDVERSGNIVGLLPRVRFVAIVGKKHHLVEGRVSVDLNNNLFILKSTLKTSCGYRIQGARKTRWERFTGTQEVDCEKCGAQTLDLDKINSDIAEAIPFLSQSI
jgi:hypothetical protein